MYTQLGFVRCAVGVHADGTPVVQCVVEHPSFADDQDTRLVIALGTVVNVPALSGSDCFQCGPCSQGGLVCTQLFGSALIVSMRVVACPPLCAGEDRAA